MNYSTRLEVHGNEKNPAHQAAKAPWPLPLMWTFRTQSAHPVQFVSMQAESFSLTDPTYLTLHPGFARWEPTLEGEQSVS